MKRIIILIALVTGFTFQAMSQKYMARNGHIKFFSEAPMENIEANNYQATSILDINSGDMAFSVLIKGFEFEKALMQEHFNEKYLHSDKFPKSTFEGKIVNLSGVDFKKPGVYPVKVRGKLNIHGVTREVESDGTLEVKSDGKIIGKSKFPVAVADYDISIPTVVKDNIAKIVDVSVDIAYEPFKKSN